MTIKITPEAVKERIAALESAGELSLKEQFYLEALRLLVAGMDRAPVVIANLSQAELDEIEKRLEHEVMRQDGIIVTPPAYPETLPCPVLLEPGMCFGRGVSTSIMLKALQRRADYCAELDAMTPEQRAEHDAGIEEFKKMLPQPAPVAPVCTCPSGDGSLRWPCPVHPGNSPETPDSCTWTFSNYDDHWSGTCGAEWVFNDGGPEENGVKFCPKCGKSVAVSATEGTEE